MQRRSFLGWLAAAIVGLGTAKAVEAATAKPSGKWHKFANVYGDPKEVVFPDGGVWVNQLVWDWGYGKTFVWPNSDRTRWLIRIQNSPREIPPHFFNGTEEQAMIEAERYTRERLAGI